MKKLILTSLLVILSFIGLAEPAFASLPYNLRDPIYRPNYLHQIEYIEQNSCDAVALVPYSGIVYYTCKTGQSFWGEVLVPSESSPLFMYFKNRKKQDDEYTEDTANSAAVSSSFTSW